LVKTQITLLSPFGYMHGMLLVELIGNAIFDKRAGIIDIGFFIILWGAILYLIEIVTQKFKGYRFILEGKPSLVLHKGEIIYEELSKNKKDMNEIFHILHKNNVISVLVL